MADVSKSLSNAPNPFSDLPPNLKTQIREGFGVLATMPESRFGELFEIVKKTLGVRRPLFEKYAKIFEMSPSKMEEMIFAMSVSVSMILTEDMSAEVFTEVAIREGAVKEEDREIVVQFALHVTDHVDSFKDVLDRARLATRTLPTFVSLSTTIDARLRFEDEKVQVVVPVAVLWLDTDKENEEVVFQATAEGVEQMIEQLQDVQRQLQATEEWIKQRPFGSGE